MGEHNSLMAQHVVSGVHAFNAEHPDDRVAIALPRMESVVWGASGKPKDTADALNHFRVFGNADALERFVTIETVDRLRRTGMVNRLRVRDIEDAEVEGYVSYHRCRAPERVTPAAVARSERRYQRRAAQRGEQRDSEALGANRLHGLAKRERTVQQHRRALFVPMRSNSTGGQGYSLLIEEKPNEAPKHGSLSSYGLSRFADHEGNSVEPFAVPRF